MEQKVETNLVDNTNLKDVFLIKYKPKSFDDAKYPKRIQTLLESEIEKFNTNKKYQMQILLHGTAGTGKTTASDIIRILTGAETKLISGSNDFNITTMREVVEPFCSTHGNNVFGKRKLLIVDEFERIAPKHQDAFKKLLDRTLCGVIMITNHFYDIIDPLRSRATCIDFNYTSSEKVEQMNNYIHHAVRIIKENNIVCDEKALKMFTYRYFPDFRQGTKILQQFHDTGEAMTEESVNNLIIDGSTNIELYEAFKIKTDAEFFTKVSEFKGREFDTFLTLGNPYFIWLNSQNLHHKTVASAIVVANYGNKLNNAPNKWVSLFACLCELRAIYLK